MAYDPVKAHEYYINFRKKGKLKGRKKGKKDEKKTKKTSLVGLSSSGLNDAGKLEYTFLKERLTEEMNKELDGVEDTDEKQSIRRKYQEKAIQAVNALKDDDRYATVSKAEKAKKAAEKQRKAEEKQRKAEERARKAAEKEKEKAAKAAEKERKTREKEAEKQRKAQEKATKAKSSSKSSKSNSDDGKSSSEKKTSSSKSSTQSTQAAKAARKASATRLKNEITRLQELIEKKISGISPTGEQISVSVMTEPQKEKTRKIISQMLDSLVDLAAK